MDLFDRKDLDELSQLSFGGVVNQIVSCVRYHLSDTYKLQQQCQQMLNDCKGYFNVISEYQLLTNDKIGLMLYEIKEYDKRLEEHPTIELHSELAALREGMYTEGIQGIFDKANEQAQSRKQISSISNKYNNYKQFFNRPVSADAFYQIARAVI
jgi:hypothetical protein